MMQANIRQVSVPIHRDYTLWTIEELRKLARQLRIADAHMKSRRELVDLLATPPVRVL